MGKYLRCGLAAAAVGLGAHGAWAQNLVGCPTGQAMQSADPSGKTVTCVAIPDATGLQTQINNEATTRQQADNALSARIDALEGVGAITEADIVGKWTVSGTTTCLQSSTGFDAITLSPIVPFLPSTAFVSQLAGTFIGTRTFNAGGTGHALGTTHALVFPGTFHGEQPVAPPPPASPFIAGVGARLVAGASVAPLDAGFTWRLEPNGTLLIDDDGTIPQYFTAPPSRIGWTVTIENVPPFVGYISKDRKTIVMTHPGMQLETSVTTDTAGTVTNRTPRFCARHRVLTRLAD